MAFVLFVLPTILFFAFIGILIWLMIRPMEEVLSNWHHTFDGFQFSSLDFYRTTEESLTKREIPSLTRERAMHQEVMFIGRSREYLRLRRDVYVYDICAAPFGTGFYVSWWFVRRTTFLRRILLRIPLVSWFLGQKTYRQADTEQMFRDLVHACVLEAVDAMTDAHGVRLTGPERAISGDNLGRK